MSGLGSEVLNCSIVAFVWVAMATPSGPPDAPALVQVASLRPALPPAAPIVITAEPETPAVQLRTETPDPALSAEEPAAAPRNREPDDTAPPPITPSPAMAGAPPTPEPDMDVVNQYLWAVYQRSPVKRDGSGDFTWKDSAAAAHAEMTLGDYVIRGMDRDFRELLYRAGQAMDAAGFRWTILSGFRDDYRQALASGYKARITDSLHGGSATTGGYRHGCAVDIKDEDGNSRGLWVWLDARKVELDLERPLPGLDPAHVQPRGPWHETGTALRDGRLGQATPAQGSPAAEPSDLGSMPPSEEDMRCIGLHHRHEEAAATIATAPADARTLKPELLTHRPGETPKGGQKAAPKQTRRGAVQLARSEGSKPAGRNKPIARTSAKLPPSNKATARTLLRHVQHRTASNTGRT
jgi:hypothetical protein